MSSSGSSGSPLPKGQVLDAPHREEQESVNNPNAGPTTSHPEVSGQTLTWRLEEPMVC